MESSASQNSVGAFSMTSPSDSISSSFGSSRGRPTPPKSSRCRQQRNHRPRPSRRRKLYKTPTRPCETVSPRTSSTKPSSRLLQFFESLVVDVLVRMGRTTAVLRTRQVFLRHTRRVGSLPSKVSLREGSCTGGGGTQGGRRPNLRCPNAILLAPDAQHSRDRDWRRTCATETDVPHSLHFEPHKAAS